MKKNTKVAVLAIVVIAAIVYAAAGGFKSTTTAPAPVATVTPTPVPLAVPAPVGAPAPLATGCATFYCGNAKPNVNDYNSLAPSTTLTEATNIITNWFLSPDGGNTFQFVSTGTGAGAVFGMTATQGGFAYSEEKPASGQNYYLDVPTMQTNNPLRYVSYQYFDIEKIGIKWHVFKWNLQNLNPLQGGQTAQDAYFNVPWFQQGTPSFGAIPSNATSIGTTAGTVKFYQFITQLDADTKAAALYSVWIKFNSTATQKWDLSNSNIDLTSISGGAQGQIPFVSMIQSQDGTNTYYRYYITTTGLNNAVFEKIPKGGLNTVYVPVKISWSLATGDSIGITLYLDYYTASLGTTEIYQGRVKTTA